MKNKDLKKGKESIIGKIIYGFLLFMPLIAILSTILISTFNMSTKETQAVTTQYETNEVNSVNDIQSGNIYKFTYNGCNQVDRQFLNANYIKISYTNNNLPTTIEYKEDTLKYLLRSKFNASMPDLYFVIFNNNNNSQNYYSFNSSYILYIVVDSIIDNDLLTYWNVTASDWLGNTNIEPITTEDIFYNAIDKVEQSELFNWAENSLIYTGIADTCTQLSITNTFIPLLLAYWLIISVIYILYDIILMILIILHNKVHQIQDSI